MTQESVKVTYSLEEVLGQINQKLDRMDDKFDNLQKEIVEIKVGQARLETELKGDIKTLESELKGDIKTLESELKGDIKTLESELKGDVKNLESELKGDIKTLESELKGDIKNLETEVNGIGKRLDTQEFINRSVVVGFVLALVAGTVKLFFPNFPN